jgi:hypothetical protein
MVEANQEYDSCDGATVKGLNPQGDGFLAVQSGPRINYPRVDKLHNGDRVITCDTYGDWFAVVYPGPGRTMESCDDWFDRNRRKTVPYTGPCRSGWVHKNWLGDFAG